MRKYNGAMAFLEFFSNLIRRVPHFTLLGSRLRGNDLIWKKNCEQSSSWVPACAGMTFLLQLVRHPVDLGSRLRGNDVG
jgi:hypothetical protein